jgi:hypothetical protein
MVSPEDKHGENDIADVQPGDTITAEVSYTENGVYHLSLIDNGKVSFSQDMQGHSDTIARNAADWIVEASLYKSSPLPLPDYGKVTFSNCSVDGKPITAGPQEYIVTLLNQALTVPLEITGSLNGTDNRFVVTWKQSQ